MNDLLRRRTVSFVVRVWAEYQVRTPASCYGEVECLNSGEKHHFRDWQEIVLFIERQTAMVVTREQGVEGNDG